MVREGTQTECACLLLAMYIYFIAGLPCHKLSQPQWIRIIQYSLLVGVTGLVWTLGLTLCGALRTILLWEHSEMALLSALGSLLTLSSAKVRSSRCLMSCD